MTPKQFYQASCLFPDIYWPNGRPIVQFDKKSEVGEFVILYLKDCYLVDTWVAIEELASKRSFSIYRMSGTHLLRKQLPVFLQSDNGYFSNLITALLSNKNIDPEEVKESIAIDLRNNHPEIFNVLHERYISIMLKSDNKHGYGI
jgi:hypothetical protein